MPAVGVLQIRLTLNRTFEDPPYATKIRERTADRLFQRAAARRGCPEGKQWPLATGALLGAPLVSPAWQAPEARPEGPLRLRAEPRRDRRALVCLDHACRQRQ